MNKNQLDRLHSYRWIVWITLLMAYIVVVFQRLSLNAVSSDLQQEFNLTASGFALLASAFPYSYLLMQIPIGIAVDYVGQRKTATAGVLLAAIGSVLFGVADHIWMLFAGRILVGIGSAAVFLSILKVQVNWFYSCEFATISGANQAVANVGGIFAQTPMVLLVGLNGWRVTYEIIAGVCLLIALFIYLLVRDRPSDMGLPSIETIEGRKETEGRDNKIWATLKQVLTNRYIYSGMIGCAVIFGSFVTFTGVWGIKYFMESSYQMTKVAAGNYSISVTLGIAFGSLIIGKISDAIKKRKALMLFTSLIGVIGWALIVFVNISEGVSLHIVTFMIGFSCAYILVSFAYVKEINDQNCSGIAVAVMNFGAILGTAVLPLFVGIVYDVNQHLGTDVTWNRCMSILLSLNILGFLATIFTKETNARNIYLDQDYENTGNVKETEY